MANDYGVSPVIGVMLMIMVTVILAAVVSAFAGDMSTTVKAAPTSTFEFKIYEKYVGASYFSRQTDSYPYIIVTLKNGETLDTQDLKIISTRKDVNGNPVAYTYDPGDNEAQRAASHKSGTSSGPPGFRSFSGPGTYKFFGSENCYWHQGDMFTGSPGIILGTALGNPKIGEIIRIEVVHKPSSTVIYQTEVTVL